MRCALCGGEIDAQTKQCVKCGECWGGGNRGVAQEVSKDLYEPYIPPEPSFTEKCISAVKAALAPADKILASSAGKAAELLKIKTTARQNKTIAYSFILAVLAVIILVPTICCTACSESGLHGRWTAADSSGSVQMEFTKDGEVIMYILSGEVEKPYRSGTYTVDGNMLEIHYDDGESITLTYSVSKDTAVFTLLSTGESQTYNRK